MERPTPDVLVKAPLRSLFVEGKDVEILDVLWNYFCAVRTRWPEAWANTGPGSVLPRTNGFRALMKVFKPVYKKLVRPGMIPTEQQYLSLLNKVTLAGADINVDAFKPASSGESELAAKMLSDMGLLPVQKAPA